VRIGAWNSAVERATRGSSDDRPAREQRWSAQGGEESMSFPV
jgi:hypothetical protein